MEKKSCFITGENSGSGQAAAIQLAQKGGVFWLCEGDKGDGSSIVKKIKEKSQNSSGADVFATIQVAKHPENKGKTIVVLLPDSVVLLPDSAERYLSTSLFD